MQVGLHIAIFTSIIKYVGHHKTVLIMCRIALLHTQHCLAKKVQVYFDMIMKIEQMGGSLIEKTSSLSTNNACVHSYIPNNPNKYIADIYIWIYNRE